MPRRYRKRKTRKGKRKSKYGKTSIIGFPSSRVMKHRWCDRVQLTSSVGAMGFTQIRANSMWDPLFPVGGHQPLGRDEISAYYSKYIVLGSKLTVQAVNRAAGNGVALCVYLADDSTAPTSYTHLKELGRGSVVPMTGDLNGKATATSHYSAKKFYNVTDINDNMERLGAAATDPVNSLVNYMVGIQSLDLSSTSQAVDLIITLDLVTLWTDQKDLPQS